MYGNKKQEYYKHEIERLNDTINKLSSELNAAKKAADYYKKHLAETTSAYYELVQDYTNREAELSNAICQFNEAKDSYNRIMKETLCVKQSFKELIAQCGIDLKGVTIRKVV